MLQEIMKNNLKDAVSIIFKTVNNVFKVKGIKGETLLQTAHRNKIELEGACEGSLACSTCHVILEKDLYNKLDEPTDREYDLLDQAYGLTSTSRLGCQIKIEDNLRNKVFRIPEATRNMSVDGYKPKPH